MSDIICTTPKSEMATAAREAAECRAEGGGYYFRVLPHRPKVEPGDRVYYVEDGYIRGFALVHIVEPAGAVCKTTGRMWTGKWSVVMLASSWCWIEPVKMKGFQRFHYAKFVRDSVKVVGGWLDEKPDLTCKAEPLAV